MGRSPGRGPAALRAARLLRWAAALLAGRAAAETGVAAWAAAWPLAAGADGWGWDAWATLGLAALGLGSAAGLRAAVVLVASVAPVVLLLQAEVLPARGRWVLGALATGLVGVGARPDLGPSALVLFGLVQVAAWPLALLAAERLRARFDRPGEPPSDPGERLAAAWAAGSAAAGLLGPWPVDLQASAVAVFLALGVPDLAAWPAAGAVAGWAAGFGGTGLGVVPAAAGGLGGALAGWAGARLGPWGRAGGLAAGAVAAAALAGHGWPWVWGVLPGAVAVGLVPQTPAATIGFQASAARAAPGATARTAVVERLREAARACLALTRELAQHEAGAGADEDAEREGLRVAEEVCPGCPALEACWKRRIPRARRLVREVWAAAQAGGVDWRRVGGPDTVVCLRPREMAEVANRHAAFARQRAEWERLLAANRQTAVVPLLGIGRALGELADEMAATLEPGAPPPDPGEAGTGRAAWQAAPAEGCWGFRAVAHLRPRPGRGVSGDAVRCRLLPRDRLALVLCDGMGSGPRAAVAAAAAAEHVLAWLAAGRSPWEALERGNEHLLAEGDGERFATVDLLLVQLRGGWVESFKMGAPASFVWHARGVREIPGGGLPAGILPRPEIRCGRARVAPGDLLVLASDGVLDGVTGGPQPARRGRAVADWLRQHAAPGVDLDGLAAALLEAARGPEPREHDDLTVLLAEVWDRAPNGGSAHVKPAAAGAGPPRGT